MPILLMPARLPEPPSPLLLQQPAELAGHCLRWRELSALALDTEFVRTRTFYPQLGLIQVGDPRGSYLIDTLTLQREHGDEALQPLSELLAEPRLTKVLHSPSEDLEVLQHVFGRFPQPLFDTQIAATLAGVAPLPGYPRLMAALFGVELPKGEQRSNWLKRPLTPSQIRYAGLDVAYLLPAHELLVERLLGLGRLDWAREEFASLAEECRARLSPELIFERLHRPSMNREQSRALFALNLWREAEARRRDLPRRFVLADEVLIELSRRRPRSPSQLREIEALSATQRRQFGPGLLEAIGRAAQGANDDDLPTPRSGRASRATVDRLRELVARHAERLELPAEFLASRKVLDDLVRGHRKGSTALPPGLQGWRARLLGPELLDELDRGAGRI